MKFYDYTVQYTKQLADGTQKLTAEKILVADEALMAAVTRGEQAYNGYKDPETTACAITKITAVLGDNDAEAIYEAKVQYITLDEKTLKEKRQTVIYAVWANNFDEARATLRDELDNGIADIDIVGLKLTKWVDAIGYEKMPEIPDNVTVTITTGKADA